MAWRGEGHAMSTNLFSLQDGAKDILFAPFGQTELLFDKNICIDGTAMARHSPQAHTLSAGSYRLDGPLCAILLK